MFLVSNKLWVWASCLRGKVKLRKNCNLFWVTYLFFVQNFRKSAIYFELRNVCLPTLFGFGQISGCASSLVRKVYFRKTCNLLWVTELAFTPLFGFWPNLGVLSANEECGKVRTHAQTDTQTYFVFRSSGQVGSVAPSVPGWCSV